MNCIPQTAAWLINEPVSIIYDGVGHGEPIHMDEIVAFLLTRGFALIPREVKDTTLCKYRRLIEGITPQGEPHIVGYDPIALTVYDVSRQFLPLREPFLYWYALPCHVSDVFVAAHARIRAAWCRKRG